MNVCLYNFNYIGRFLGNQLHLDSGLQNSSREIVNFLNGYFMAVQTCFGWQGFSIRKGFSLLWDKKWREHTKDGHLILLFFTMMYWNTWKKILPVHHRYVLTMNEKSIQKFGLIFKIINVLHSHGWFTVFTQGWWRSKSFFLSLKILNKVWKERIRHELFTSRKVDAWLIWIKMHGCFITKKLASQHDVKAQVVKKKKIKEAEITFWIPQKAAYYHGLNQFQQCTHLWTIRFFNVSARPLFHN